MDQTKKHQYSLAVKAFWYRNIMSFSEIDLGSDLWFSNINWKSFNCFFNKKKHEIDMDGPKLDRNYLWIIQHLRWAVYLVRWPQNEYGLLYFLAKAWSIEYYEIDKKSCQQK